MYHTGDLLIFVSLSLIHISLNEKDEILENGDLLIEDDLISEVGRGLNPQPGDQVIDCTGKLVMPGLVNAPVSYTHLDVYKRQAHRA